MIPHRIHRIWLGSKQIPEEYENWWNGWRRQFPSYEFRTWGNEDMKELESFSKINVADSPARKADIARYEILAKFGGIYLDCDMMPLNYFDISQYDADLVVCGAEPDHFCPIGFLASNSNNETMKLAVDRINQMVDVNMNPPQVQTGPVFFGNILQPDLCKNLPEETFYPYGFDKPFSSILEKDLGNTFGIHVWGGSWASDEQKILKSLQKLLHGDAAEPEWILKYFPECGTKTEIISFVKRLRSVRRSELDLVRNPIMGNVVAPVNLRYFDLFKTCSFLLTKDPSAKIWQIGAGDGAHKNALRPVMINFDPIAVLVEPDSDLFRELGRNYANNKNSKLVNAAFGREPSLGKIRVVDTKYLYSLQDGSYPDILSLDLSGAGCDLLMSIMLNGARPKIMKYDSENMGDIDKQAIHEQLVGEYELITIDEWEYAYRKDFFLEYCEYLFIDYGIPNVFRDSLKLINGL